MCYGAMICLFGAMVGRGSSIDIRGGKMDRKCQHNPSIVSCTNSGIGNCNILFVSYNNFVNCMHIIVILLHINLWHVTKSMIIVPVNRKREYPTLYTLVTHRTDLHRLSHESLMEWISYVFFNDVNSPKVNVLNLLYMGMIYVLSLMRVIPVQLVVVRKFSPCIGTPKEGFTSWGAPIIKSIWRNSFACILYRTNDLQNTSWQIEKYVNPMYRHTKQIWGGIYAMRCPCN